MLDTTNDTTSTNDVCSFDQIVRREAEEELGITDSIDSVDCFGVFSEVMDDFAVNPDIFSATRIETTPSEILSRARTVDDR